MELGFKSITWIYLWCHNFSDHEFLSLWVQNGFFAGNGVLSVKYNLWNSSSLQVLSSPWILVNVNVLVRGSSSIKFFLEIYAWITPRSSVDHQSVLLIYGLELVKSEACHVLWVFFHVFNVKILEHEFLLFVKKLTELLLGSGDSSNGVWVELLDIFSWNNESLHFLLLFLFKIIIIVLTN